MSVDGSNSLSRLAASFALLLLLVVPGACGGSDSGRSDTASPDTAGGDEVVDDATVADTGDAPQDISSDAPLADVGHDLGPVDVGGDTVDELAQVFSEIRPECRPADLGCTGDEACTGAGQRCVGSRCVDAVAPADYEFSVATQRVRALMLPGAGVQSGFDQNGDGIPDNVLGTAVATFPGGTDLVNRTVADYVDSGRYVYVLELRNVPEDGCGPLEIAIHSGTADIDHDGMPDAEAEGVQVLRSGFRPDGYGPIAQLNTAAIDGDLVVSGRGASLNVPIPLPDGAVIEAPVEGLRVRARLDLAGDGARKARLRPLALDDPGVPENANAEVGGYIRIESFVTETNARAVDCGCAGIDPGQPVAEYTVEADGAKARCVQTPGEGCEGDRDGLFCENLAATCVALTLMSEMADVASGEAVNGAGEPVPDALSLAFYAEVSPAGLAEPPLAPDFGAVPDLWQALPMCELLQDAGPAQLGVLMNDFYDASVSPVIVAVTQSTAGGSVSLPDRADRVVYTAPSGFYGFDDFTYTIQDAGGNESTATVALRVSPSVAFDPDRSLEELCTLLCEQSRVCAAEEYAAAWGDDDAVCRGACMDEWGSVWDMTSFCAQARRADALCRVTLTCPQLAVYQEAETLAADGEDVPPGTYCGARLEARLARCGSCEPGFWGEACQECPNGAALPCGGNAVCVDGSDGDGECVCEPGYVYDGGECVDIDECAAETDPCAPHGTCVNRVGSYLCGCADGYVFDGATCAAYVDACHPNPCVLDTRSPTQACTIVADSPTPYECDCDQDYPWDATVGACRSAADACDPNLCLRDPLSDGSCYPDDGTRFWCECVPIFVHFWDWEAHRCVDPCEGNSCADDPNSTGACEPDSAIGTPTCVCIEDYYWDFTFEVCRSVSDGCAPDICHLIPNAIAGSCSSGGPFDYTCDCETNYAWSADARECVASR